jgi:CRISPR/Cas system-associated protein Csx1
MMYTLKKKEIVVQKYAFKKITMSHESTHCVINNVGVWKVSPSYHVNFCKMQG